MITFTDKGAEKVQEFLAGQSADVQTSGLRVGVRGGGCSGFQYALAFDSQRPGDQVFEDHGLRILVDGPSLPYVRGAVVDYVEGLQGAGFKVDNPNVVAACGCGSSFRVAEEEGVSGVGDRLSRPPCWRPRSCPAAVIRARTRRRSRLRRRRRPLPRRARPRWRPARPRATSRSG